jgi:hypothetical protein
MLRTSWFLLLFSSPSLALAQAPVESEAPPVVVLGAQCTEVVIANPASPCEPKTPTTPMPSLGFVFDFGTTFAGELTLWGLDLGMRAPLGDFASLDLLLGIYLGGDAIGNLVIELPLVVDARFYLNPTDPTRLYLAGGFSTSLIVTTEPTSEAGIPGDSASSGAFTLHAGSGIDLDVGAGVSIDLGARAFYRPYGGATNIDDDYGAIVRAGVSFR